MKVTMFNLQYACGWDCNKCVMKDHRDSLCVRDEVHRICGHIQCLPARIIVSTNTALQPRLLAYVDKVREIKVSRKLCVELKRTLKREVR